eukprot:5529665-Pyramimonas_sp.AAC.1
MEGAQEALLRSPLPFPLALDLLFPGPRGGEQLLRSFRANSRRAIRAAGLGRHPLPLLRGGVRRGGGSWAK